MQKVSRHTKSKIIAGYVIVVILSAASIFLIYRQILRLTIEESGTGTGNRKLFIISNTVTGLYEAEAFTNAFIQTGSDKAFKRLMLSVEEVEGNIDSLKNMTDNYIQKSRLDSIGVLLQQKSEALDALIKAKQSLKTDDFYNQAVASIEAEKDSAAIQKNVRQRITTTVDTTFQKTGKKRRNFWGWLTGSKPDSTLQVTVSHHTITDTLRSGTQLQNTDTVLSTLKSVWEDVQEKNKNLSREISRTEYNIILQSTNITNQLRRLLGEYENEELASSFQRIGQREQAINQTTRIIAGIAIAASILILLLCFYILRDISRSQLYRRQLEEANRYSDQLLKSREKLMLTVTHDIKSPLSSIIGYTELLESTPVNGKQQHFLENMKSSSRHILHLVTNLLDYSQLENNTMKTEEVIFRPGQLFREICESFLPMADSKKLSLEYHPSEGLDKEYTGDALRIRQILVNLLSNAVKYTEKGSITLSATSTTDHKIILKIKDTGAGMTEAEQQIIFQEFTRLSATSSIEGTGLGLTITLKLIELLHGQIHLDSQPGKGSCFTVELPLKQAQTSIIPSDKKSESVSVFPPRSLKILLVDDDPLQLEMTAALLEGKGIEADTTSRPQEVMDLLTTRKYDIIFTDIQMPDMTGFDLIRAIRDSSIPGAQKLPVIALSANAGKSGQDYSKAGFTAYLGKPFTPQRLFSLLENLSGQTISAPISPEEPTGNNGNQTFSLKNIRMFTDGDETATLKIISSFIHDNRNHMQMMAGYIQSHETEEIARLAHKMLPMFRQFETGVIIDPLEKLETSGRCNLPESEIYNLVNTVLRETEKLLEELENIADRNHSIE